MLFADFANSGIAGLGWLMIGVGAFLLVFMILMIIFRPDLVKAHMEDQRHKREMEQRGREQRNRVLGGIAKAGLFVGKSVLNQRLGRK